MKNTFPSETDPTDEAIAWQMKLADAPGDAALLTGLHAWRNARPDNERAWRKAERVRNLARMAIREAAVETSRMPTRVVPTSLAGKESRTRSNGLRWLAWASPLAFAAVVLSVLCGPAIYDRLWADEVTGAGGLRNVVLHDGTEITLGAETSIAIDNASRRVTLLKGEALFHVTHDAAHPFTIRAGSVTLRDIGTIFDVRKDGGRLTLAVREGTVGLRAPQSAITAEEPVNAGRQIIVTEGSMVVERSVVEPDTVGSWRSGVLAVDKIAITDLLHTLERYYPGYVVLRGYPASADQVGGIYDLRQPVDSLRMLVAAHGGAVSEYAGRLLVVTFGRAKGAG